MSKHTNALVVMAGVTILLAVTGCGAASDTGTSQTTPVAETPSATPTPTPTSVEPSEQPTEVASTSATEPYASASATDTTLTAKNNKDLATILKLPDYCDGKIAAFANTYAGQTIEFDGSIAAMSNHGDYTTRYDILVAPGNKGPRSTIGPAFKFEDVNIFDLELTGTNIPDTVGVGDRLRVLAIVGEVNQDQCLFFLDPVSTQIR